MNALVQKEVRLLLPSFVIGLLLTFSVLLIPGEPDSAPGIRSILVIFPFLLCPAIVVMMALDSVGRELSAGTFSSLLAQPISRARIWWTKALLLAAAIVSVWAAWWLSLLNNKSFTMNPKELHEAFVTTVLFALVAYSGGLWTVLLLRHVAAAFWLTLLIPAALAMFTAYVTEKYGSAGFTERNLTVVLVAYSIAGFWGARRMFLRAQDVQWTSGTIALPGWLKFPRWFDATRRIQGRRPRLALLAKELQLHQSQFVIAGVLALLHLAVIATRKFGGDFKSSPALEFLLGQFWVLWFAMPLLVGCATVAEERRLGTLEGQLCLPVRRRTQFVIKFFSALLLSVILGGVIPLLLEGGSILPDPDLKGVSSDSSDSSEWVFGGVIVQTVLIVVAEIMPLRHHLTLAGIAALVGIISFYASTLARNTLQAFAPAVLGIIVTWALLLGASQIENIFQYPFWRGWLVYLLGVPMMTLALAALTYWNYQRVLVGWNVWRRNALVFFTALAVVIGATTAIYHRVWERLTPLEPPHGVARLAPSQPVTLRNEWVNLTAQLPDGRFWSSRFTLSAPTLASMLSGDWTAKESLGRRGFLEGTNWASVAVCYRDVAGIRKDGSLWVSEQPEKLFWSRSQTQSRQADPPRMVRLGLDNDWKSVAGNFSQAFLLKTDGTLWRLGTNRFDRKKPRQGLRAFEPQRLGTDSDWAEIFSTEGLIFRKTDGRVWVVQGQRSSKTEFVRLDEQLFIERATLLDHERWRGRTPASAPGLGFQVGVREDGTFRVTEAWQWHTSPSDNSRQWGLVKHDVLLGKETNWLGVAGNREVVVTLKADGSLWKWHFPDDPISKPGTASAALLSKHSDWLAIAEAMGGVVSLAADGGLWFWQFEPRHEHPSEQTIPPLLAASRRPQLIGNIFASSAQ